MSAVAFFFDVSAVAAEAVELASTVVGATVVSGTVVTGSVLSITSPDIAGIT